MATHPLWRTYSSSANAVRQANRIAHRQVQPGPLQEYTDDWAKEYEIVRLLVEEAIPDQTVAISHVGSTAVAGLMAKPVIDVDLTVPDAADELAYVPRLEAAGFRLIFRDDIGGDVHRQLTLGAPNANLHVWSPGAVEPQRHAVFTSWLRAHAADRDRYAAAKRDATQGAVPCDITTRSPPWSTTSTSKPSSPTRLTRTIRSLGPNRIRCSAFLDLNVDSG